MWRLFEPWIKVVKTVQGPGFYPSSSFVALSMPASRDRAEDPSVWSRPATNYKEASSLQTFRTVLSPGQPGRNAAWKGQTSAHPEIDNEQKKKDFMPKMPPSRKHFTEAHGNLCNNTITCCMCSCFNNHTVTLCLHPQSGLQGTSLQPPPWKFSKNVAKLLVMLQIWSHILNQWWLVMQSTLHWPAEAAPTSSCFILSVRSCSGSTRVNILSQWQAGPLLTRIWAYCIWSALSNMWRQVKGGRGTPDVR